MSIEHKHQETQKEALGQSQIILMELLNKYALPSLDQTKKIGFSSTPHETVGWSYVKQDIDNNQQYLLSDTGALYNKVTNESVCRFC